MNKKLILILSTLVIFVGVAAFIAGRMFSQGVGPLGLFEKLGDGFLVTEILPAEELPKRSPEVEGLLVERRDSIVFIETGPPGGSEMAGPVGAGGGPKVEVVVTNETIIYQDTTEPPSERPTADNNPPIQQTVEAGNLEDLFVSHSLVMVWGHQSGDRLIAEVLLYNNPVKHKTP